MVKQVLVLPRRRDLSPQQFHDHWRHPHATMARRIPTLAGYVQNHRLDSTLLGPEQRRYDGVVEAWFENADVARGAVDDPIYSGFLAGDEPNFIDMSGMQGLLVDEELLIAGAAEDAAEPDAAWDHTAPPFTIKLLQFVEEEGDEPWESDDDGELARRLAALRYVRSRPAGSAGDWGDGAEDLAFVGIHELWWPTLMAFERGVAAAPNYLEMLLARPARGITMLTQAERVV